MFSLQDETSCIDTGFSDDDRFRFEGCSCVPVLIYCCLIVIIGTEFSKQSRYSKERYEMKRRKFLKTTALSAAALGTSHLYPCAPASKRPNVIVILTDDQGCGDLSIYGNPILKTPHTDRFASESVRFTDFHVTPASTSTRSQLMTGLDCLHNLACAVTAGRTVMRRDIPTAAELFQRGGYATGLFGKWHLGHAYPDRPQDRGFDKCVWFKGWGLQSEIEFDNDYINPRYLDGLVEKRASVYCTDLWFQEAMRWMAEQRKKDRPFFVYLPTNAPHMPLWPPEDATDLYEGTTDKFTADYFAMIANLDNNVGKLDDWLKRSGLYESTIVIFLSDNGSAAGLKLYNAGLRGGKASLYEGGHRVPCFLRWPGTGFGYGVNQPVPTRVQDLLPTLLDLCKVPAGGAKFDGVSLVPLLKTGKLEDRMFVVQYGQRRQPVKYNAAVIWGRWRLQNGKELYDIVKDPGQQKDVAAGHPEIIKRMKACYEDWWRGLPADLWEPIPMLIGTEAENPVLLTSIDWWEVDADNVNFVSQGVGGPRGGVWTVQAQTSGSYRIELRRWPFHTDMPIGSEGPRETIRGRKLNHRYRLIPACKTVLRTDGNRQLVSVFPDSAGAVFEVPLSKGIHKIQGWFCDEDGRDLCGAYYALITRLPA